MTKTKDIERTAVSPFTLAGEHIPRGKVVKLTRDQLKKLVAAGVVMGSDEDNAEVPVISTSPDHDALEAAAGNLAHTGTEEPQTFGTTETARAAAEAGARAQAEAQEIARRAEIDAAARRMAETEAEKARLADIQAKAETEAKAKADAEARAKTDAVIKGPTPATGAAPAAGAAVKSNVPPVPMAPAKP